MPLRGIAFLCKKNKKIEGFAGNMKNNSILLIYKRKSSFLHMSQKHSLMDNITFCTVCKFLVCEIHIHNREEGLGRERGDVGWQDGSYGL